MNTLNSNIFFECNIGYARASALGGNNVANTMDSIASNVLAYTLNFYANFDVIYAIENGTVTARF